MSRSSLHHQSRAQSQEAVRPSHPAFDFVAKKSGKSQPVASPSSGSEAALTNFAGSELGCGHMSQHGYQLSLETRLTTLCWKNEKSQMILCLFRQIVFHPIKFQPIKNVECSARANNSVYVSVEKRRWHVEVSEGQTPFLAMLGF